MYFFDKENKNEQFLLISLKRTVHLFKQKIHQNRTKGDLEKFNHIYFIVYSELTLLGSTLHVMIQCIPNGSNQIFCVSCLTQNQSQMGSESCLVDFNKHILC